MVQEQLNAEIQRLFKIITRYRRIDIIITVVSSLY